MNDLELYLQFHEEISLIYLVDHYEARLSTRDHAEYVVLVGCGDTIYRSMLDLAEKCADVGSVEAIRKLPLAP